MATIYVCNVGNESPEPLGMPSMVTNNGRQAPRSRDDGDQPAPLGKPSLNAQPADNGRDRAVQGGQGGASPADNLPEPLGKPRL